MVQITIQLALDRGYNPCYNDIGTVQSEALGRAISVNLRPDRFEKHLRKTCQVWTHSLS